ncbi:MAG: hypothetical protein KDC95_00100 [Planctomycetes bacterium]|nr:hypothetical protein [Planctomycetota bacterium]
MNDPTLENSRRAGGSIRISIRGMGGNRAHGEYGCEGEGLNVTHEVLPHE